MEDFCPRGLIVDCAQCIGFCPSYIKCELRSELLEAHNTKYKQLSARRVFIYDETRSGDPE